MSALEALLHQLRDLGYALRVNAFPDGRVGLIVQSPGGNIRTDLAYGRGDTAEEAARNMIEWLVEAGEWKGRIGALADESGANEAQVFESLYRYVAEEPPPGDAEGDEEGRTCPFCGGRLQELKARLCSLFQCLDCGEVVTEASLGDYGLLMADGYECSQCGGGLFWEPPSELWRCRRCGTAYTKLELAREVRDDAEADALKFRVAKSSLDHEQQDDDEDDDEDLDDLVKLAHDDPVAFVKHLNDVPNVGEFFPCISEVDRDTTCRSASHTRALLDLKRRWHISNEQIAAAADRSVGEIDDVCNLREYATMDMLEATRRLASWKQPKAGIARARQLCNEVATMFLRRHTDD